MSQAPFVAPVHPGIQGKSIFPIGMNKRPLFSWGEYAERVPTQEEKDSWRHLHDGPWALATGPISGVIVLDFDGLEGAILFQKLKKEGKHVDTWMALTPSKGVHLYYECPNGPLAEKIRNGVRVLPGLDVRAKGGYVGVPCACKDGRKWLTPPIFPPAPLPQWFVETIGKNSSIPVLPPPEGGLPKGVEEGKRNYAAASLAGRYIKRGNTVDETAILLTAWNQQNRPPLPPSEIRAVVESIHKKELARTGSIEVIDGHALVAMDINEPELLVTPFLPTGGKMFLAATGGTGKTLLALNLAVSLANELPLFGRFSTRKGRTLYVDAEGTHSLTRFRFNKIVKGVGGLMSGVSFSLPGSKLDLGNIRARDELCREIERYKASLVILDSFLCFAPVRNENDNTEVRSFLERVGEIPKKTGAAMVFIDHAGKPSVERVKSRVAVTPRGAGAKNDWADAVLILEERKSDARFLRSLIFNKTRYCAPIPPILLEMSTNFIFSASGMEEICPIFTVKQIVSDKPGITWGELCEKLQGQTGCSRTTAYHAIKQAVNCKEIDKITKGRTTEYIPKMFIQQELTKAIDDEEPWGE